MFVNFISIQFTAAPLSALSRYTAAARTGNRTLGPWPRPRPHPRPGEPWAGRLKTRTLLTALPDGEGPDEAVDGAVAGPVAGALRHRAEHRAAQPLCPTAASQLGRGQTRGNILFR